MTILRAACIAMICLIGLWLFLLPFAYVVDPFQDYEPWGWQIIPVIFDGIFLIVSAIAVLMHKAYGWWICQVLFVINFVASLFPLFPVGILSFGALLVIFSLTPPWKWTEKALE